MPRYRKKPVEVEAVQVMWKNWNDICEFLGEIISKDNPARSVNTYSCTCDEEGPYIEISIPTLEGVMIARHGDLIIKGVNNEFYPCKPDIFFKTYEKID